MLFYAAHVAPERESTLSGFYGIEHIRFTGIGHSVQDALVAGADDIKATLATLSFFSIDNKMLFHIGCPIWFKR